MSFAGSFWNILNYAHNQSSHLDELLSQPDCTLEQLLDDENILTEFKSMNPRLLEFQTDDRVKQLLSYLIEEPPEDADRSRGYKYPFIACEVLTADIQTLLSAFFGKNPNNHGKKEHDNAQESSEEYEDYQKGEQNTGEEKENENQDKKEAHEENEEESENKEESEEPKEINEELKPSEEAHEAEENKENVETEKETEKEGEEEQEEKGQKGEIEENKENVEIEEGEIEEPRKKERFSITVRSPQEDVESQNSEESQTQAKMDLAHYFFSFLNNETLNVTLVGYFSRFLNHLLLRRTTETVEFIWNNPYIVEGLIRHIEHSCLADCLAKIFCMENLPSTLINDFVDIRLRKLAQLVDIFDTETSQLTKKSEAISYSCYIICEIIQKKSSVLKGGEFLNYFFSKEFLEIFFNNIFRHSILETHLSSILNALLQAILQKKATSKPKQSVDSESSDDDETKIVIDFDEHLFYDFLVPKIGEIAEYLESGTDKEVERTYGGKQRLFGVGKLRLVESILHMVKLNVNKISMEIGLKKLFGVLLVLMTTYEWNNMLHNTIEKIIISTLESDSHVLKQKLLIQANLVGFLNEATKEVYYKMPNEQKRKMRKGYLGHITRIGKALESLADVDSDIKEYISNETWKEFYDYYLKPSIKNENHDLAGFSKKKSEDISDDNIHIGNNIDEALGGKFDSFFGIEIHENTEDKINGDAAKKDFVDWMHLVDKYGEDKAAEIQASQADNEDKLIQECIFNFFEGTPEKDKENIYLKLNSEVKIIEMEKPEEVEVDPEFLGNQYWARPTGSTAQLEDILNEIESEK